jgi:hypothetical protein
MSGSSDQDDEGTTTLRWVFVRGPDQIELRRSVAPTSTRVEVCGIGRAARVFTFADRAALVAFHTGFEHALMETGWALEQFSPERRSGSDRRAVPRATDRRSLSLAWSR